MEVMKKVKREFEVKEIDKVLCNNCNKEIEYPHACGFGAEYQLYDAWCKKCGGKRYDFCSFKCLKEFVNSKLKKGMK